MKTRERIIHCALALFNAEGEPNITTNHIAAKLEISPGNLYYHFGNKQEIIHSIFDLYALALSQVNQPNLLTQNEPKSLLTYLDKLFTLMWEFRFFYANLPDILCRDKHLQEKYLQLQQTMHSDLLNILQDFQIIGWLDIEDENLVQLSILLKFTATCWIFYQGSQAPNLEITPLSIHHGVLQILCILKPHATLKGQLVLQELIEHHQQLFNATK